MARGIPYAELGEPAPRRQAGAVHARQKPAQTGMETREVGPVRRTSNYRSTLAKKAGYPQITMRSLRHFHATVTL